MADKLNGLEKLKEILREKVPEALDAELQSLMSELTIASGNGAISISGDVAETVIVTGNKNIVGDNNRVIINQGIGPDELIKMLRQFFQHNEKTAFALRTISHTMTTVFIDLMRLLYVATSDIARAANVVRYPEFIDIAEQHFDDLRSHVARSSNELNAQMNELSLNIDKRISFILGRLRRGPDLHGNDDDCFKKMKQIGQQVHNFCTSAMGTEYKDIFDVVDAHLSRVIEEFNIVLEVASLNDIFKLRLYVQSQVLQGGFSSDGSRIFTIADDMDQDFGIRYFALDKKLLDRFSLTKDS